MKKSYSFLLVLFLCSAIFAEDGQDKIFLSSENEIAKCSFKK